MRSALVALVLAAAPAAAQFGYNPWTGQGNGMGTPWGYGNGFGPGAYGYTNGYNQFSVWNRSSVYMNGAQYQLAYQQTYQQAQLQAAVIWNPALAPYWAARNGLTGGWNQTTNYAWNANFAGNGFGFNINSGFSNNAGYGYGYGTGYNNPWGGQVVSNNMVPGQFGVNQYEPGRFVRVGQDLAVNNITGTVLQPYSGVAYTNEGTFYRLPGTGTFNAYGAYLPGSGVYFNPFTGTAYNPRTGAIRR